MADQLKKKSCRPCPHFETFNKRPDEISNMGCRHPNWAGYIIDIHSPACAYPPKEEIKEATDGQ